jgi:glycosyltransferase involved in cell wall biosynthesis
MTELAVIMSVYRNDRLSFLKESVQSILDQTFSHFHYYITLDGPVDPEIENYLASLSDTRIKLYRLEKNVGLARALNHLLEFVLKNPGYKLIARMDADDISSESRFEKQYNFMSENPDISCIGSWYEEIDEAGNHLSYCRLPVEHEALKKRYSISIPFAHPTVMYRRTLIETAGFYPVDTLLMEDNVLWGMALKHGFKFGNIPEFLFKFRIDRNFYRRRSGIKYGWSYICTRNKINRIIKSPFQAYFFSVVKGLVKMLPSSLIQPVYDRYRRWCK